MNLNKAALAQKIADKVGVSKKEAEEMIAAFTEIVTETLQDDNSVTIAGFGAFSSKVRAGRVGVNPQNPKEKIQIPPVKVPKFKAGLALKKALKEEHNVEEPNGTVSESDFPHQPAPPTGTPHTSPPTPSQY